MAFCMLMMLIFFLLFLSSNDEFQYLYMAIHFQFISLITGLNL